MKSGLTLEQRFWYHVNKTSECWEWTGALNTGGYAQIWTGSANCRRISVHRLSYEIHYGKIPEGLCVLHKCDNRKCVNPDHLFLGTSKDNADDCMSKGRATVPPLKLGVDHGRSKLTDEQVMEIRSDPERFSHEGKMRLAGRHGVHYSLICKILRWANWKHLRNPEQVAA